MPGEPVCSIIIFCDYVITDALTGKNSLIGSFPNINSPQFPLTLPQFFAHVTISNFMPAGKQINLAVNLKQVSSGAVIASVGTPIVLPATKNPAETPNGVHVNMNIPFRNVTFTVPGLYECEVFFDAERIGGRFLEVLQRQPQLPMPLNPSG